MRAQQSIVDNCRQSLSDTDRIACLEAALLSREAETATIGDTDPVTNEQVPASDPSPAPLEGSVAQPVSQIDTVSTEVTDIGAEQVAAKHRTQEEFVANLESARGLRVASYDTVLFQRLLVRLENGQVWRQIKGDTQTVNVDLRRNQTVDITESSLGGYRLRLNEIRRTIRVQRIK